MFFVAASFSDKKVAELFDLARLVVEGDYARPAHITLRGPYKSKGDIHRGLLEKDVGVIHIRRPGHFFNGRQNTVFLGIEILGISEFWYKPDFPEGVPHLTIYDGSDRRFAWIVFNILRKHTWNLSLNSTRMSILEKKKTVEDSFLDIERFPAKLLRSVFARDILASDVRELPDLERAIALNKICSMVHIASRPSSTQI